MSVYPAYLSLLTVTVLTADPSYGGGLSESQLKLLLWISLAGFALAVAIASLLYYLLRLRARTQRIMRSMARTRQNFFTNITHEFRTPLTVIIGMTQDLKKKLATDKKNEKEFDIVLRNADNLLLLVNQLLDIAKINSSAGRPEWRHGDVMMAVNMSVDNIRPYAFKKLIDIEFASSSQELMMDFVPDYINKIMLNLLSNAVKFSDKGDVISILVSGDSDEMSITVSDTGIGMDSSDIENIFEPFYQGVNSSGRSGTGIGLPLVKQMVTVMGGRIEAYSIKGQGSSFVVTLPVRQNKGVLSEIKAFEKNEDSVYDDPIHQCMARSDERPSILIVEDNEDIASYIGQVLKDQYTLIFAQSGEHGLDKAEAYVPDLIISDVMMPGMDGYELCRMIRSSELLNHIPIIILSARSEEADKMSALRCGADSYLVKPFNREELRLLTANLLMSKETLRRKLSKAIDESSSDISEIPEAEKAFLAKFHGIVMNSLSDSSLSSETIAERIFISRSQLNRKVKAITGTDTASYIRKTRLDYAASRLDSTDTPVGDIVFQCGFESASHFSKLFREHYGMTPSEYRKKKNS